jgi:precorrin-2 dehydrogenase/sirohydrochlorin ferrochelatase
MALFPMFVKLSGRKCVVVGAGQIAEGKAAGLLRAGAKVVVVAPEASERIQAQARAGKLSWLARTFAASDLEGAFLTIAATDSAETNRRIFQCCTECGVLCNVVDDPEYCDFFYPAVVRRGALQIAISTEAHSPALARRLRRELEQQFGPEYEDWIEHVAGQRREILSRKLPDEERRRLLEQIASREAFEKFVAQRKK